MQTVLQSIDHLWFDCSTLVIGHDSVVEFLLSVPQSQADVLSITTAGGKNALHLAALHGHLGVIKLLYGHSESNNNSQKEKSHANGGTTKCASACDVLESVTSEGQAIVHLAAFRGHESIVAFLAEPTDSRQCDSDGLGLGHGCGSGQEGSRAKVMCGVFRTISILTLES